MLSMTNDTDELEEQLEQITSSFQLPPELDFHAMVHPFLWSYGACGNPQNKEMKHYMLSAFAN